MGETESLSSLTWEAALQDAQGDQAALLQTARRMRSLYPLAEPGYRYEYEALTAVGDRIRADAIVEAGSRLFPDSVWMARHIVNLSFGNAVQSGPVAPEAANSPPCGEDLAACLARAGAACAERRSVQASRILMTAFDRFPGQTEVVLDWARQALTRDDWRDALWRLQVTRDYDSDHPAGYAEAAHALRHLRRLDEADAVIVPGLRRMPDNLEILVSYAWTAMVRCDWPEAEHRWRTVLERHPHSAHGYVGLAEAFRCQQNHTESEAVLWAGLQATLNHVAVAEAFAMLATRLEAWPEAERRWRAVRSCFPESAMSHHQLAIALRKLGQAENAEIVIGDGVRLVLEYLPLAIEHAWCANARNDWAEALRLWEALDQRYPVDIAVKEGLVAARLGAVEAGLQMTAENCPAKWQPASETDLPHEIIGRFEGLGENCEFGLAQRYFDIEPISLFRWVAIGMPSLASALENRLEGVGNPEQTELSVTQGGEYYVSDTRYGFGMHTFVQQDNIDRDKFFTQQCRRLRYLAAKLLEDLMSSRKVFVSFKEGMVDKADLTRLHNAVSSYGAATLLQVGLSDGEHPPGTVKRAARGLLMGYIGRFGKRPPASWDIDYQGWLTICRETLRLTSDEAKSPAVTD